MSLFEYIVYNHSFTFFYNNDNKIFKMGDNNLKKDQFISENEEIYP